MPGNLSGRTDGQTDGRTDGRTCRKTVTVGRVDQRTHVQVKRGYFRLRTDGQTDGRTGGQPENIMPPAPKGGGIKKSGKLFRGRDLILMKPKHHVSLAGSSTNSPFRAFLSTRGPKIAQAWQKSVSTWFLRPWMQINDFDLFLAVK